MGNALTRISKKNSNLQY